VSNYYTASGAVGANDGINLNMYQWFIRQLNTATTTVTSASQLEEEQLSSSKVDIIVTPNPFTSQASAQISLDKPQRLYINLTDMTGRLVQSVTGMYGVGNTEVKLNVSGLPKGVYLLKVSGENFTTTQKLVRQ
jgi:hypothetical protein